MSQHISRALRGLFLPVMVMLPSVLFGQEVPLATDRWNRAALEWVGLLKAGAFQEAGARVDPAVPEGAMGPAQLETLWGQISAQMGALHSLEAGRVEVVGTYQRVNLPAAFENQGPPGRVDRFPAGIGVLPSPCRAPSICRSLLR
jgi:hypothetical protein